MLLLLVADRRGGPLAPRRFDAREPFAEARREVKRGAMRYWERVLLSQVINRLSQTFAHPRQS